MAVESNAWREAAYAFELRAMRVEYVVRLLVAAGHVTQEKVDEAFNIAREFKRAGMGVPQEPSWLDEAMKLAQDYARAWQHDADGNYVIKDQAPKAKDKLRAHLTLGVLGTQGDQHG